MVPPLFPAYHAGRVSASGTSPNNWASSAPAEEDLTAEQELVRLQQEDTALEQCWRSEAAAQSAAFERELAAFRERQKLAAEKEAAIEHQRQLVADQAAALDSQRQALALQQQQLHEAQRSLELNRQAAALAQEQRGRVQAAANIRTAAELARQVADENAILEAALVAQQRRADDLAAADRLVQQRQLAAAEAEAARIEEEAQALEAANIADRLAEQQHQLVADARVVLGQDAAVPLPAEVGGQPAAVPAVEENPPVAGGDQPAVAGGQPAAEPVDLPQVGTNLSSKLKLTWICGDKQLVIIFSYKNAIFHLNLSLPV